MDLKPLVTLLTFHPNPIAPKPKASSSDAHNHLHHIMRNIMVIAQFFGQLPIKGVTSPSPVHLSFSYASPRFIYSLLPLAGTLFVLGMLVYKMVIDGSNLFIITTFIYHMCNLGTTLSFLHAASVWPKLMRQWHSIEVHMRPLYGWPKKLAARIHTIAITISSVALIEYLALQANDLLLAQKCHHLIAHESTIEYYYKRLVFPYIFAVLPYNLCVAITLHCVNFFSGFTWCYGDLFIMVMSSAIAMRFAQITERLKEVLAIMKDKNRERDPRWKVWMCVTDVESDPGDHSNGVERRVWKDIREDYNKLCVLCRILDDAISYLMLMSFSTNLFFILIQLFNSLRNMKNTAQKVYFFMSFGFLITRTIAVSLYAAWVNDESKKPLLVLNSIPSHAYNLEIKRFVQQISFDSVALTGRNFFTVTRGLILSVAGAIVTYELVLIQFNENLLRGNIELNPNSPNCLNDLSHPK